jgi:hypothetical protein
MIGKYTKGSNKAHKCCAPHREVFGCRMYGTFNIFAYDGKITEFQPTITTKKSRYWFVKISRDNDIYFGWAVRDFKSRQRANILEIVTKELLPDKLKEGDFEVEVFEKWDDRTITGWAINQYWFQGFSFSPKKKADSKFLWDTINVIDWSDCTVLDIGCHYGYFSFEASREGARAIGFDTNKSSLKTAEVIRDNIIHQDVSFSSKDPKGNFDVILYLSVHHQPDPNYKKLAEKIAELKSRAKKYLFVELILPPMFPKDNIISEEMIDKIVGGKILATYKHKVRGMRKVYQITTG